MLKFILTFNFILILINSSCLAESFNKTIAMHGTTLRNEDARDTKVNINAPIKNILKLAKTNTQFGIFLKK